MVKLPERILHLQDSLPELIAHTYPNVHKIQPTSYFEERCILAPQNTKTNNVNDCVLENFPGEVCEVWANDHAVDVDHCA